jgi:hypothetical protein
VKEKIAQHRRDLLREMSLIERMEFGSLAEEYREAEGGGGEAARNGPYYKHQKWEAGRNRSRRERGSCSLTFARLALVPLYHGRQKV